MGALSSATPCTQPTVSQEELRPPWAIAQAEHFESDECPFCGFRRSHCDWLQTEILRLTSEVASLEIAIPQKLHPDLTKWLSAQTLPDSEYTGGVDDIRSSACSQCSEHRREVRRLQDEARTLDAHCKARIEFHRCFACQIEEMLMEKRRTAVQHLKDDWRECRQDQPREGQDHDPCNGHLHSISKVDQPENDVAPDPPAPLTPKLVASLAGRFLQDFVNQIQDGSLDLPFRGSSSTEGFAIESPLTKSGLKQ